MGTVLLDNLPRENDGDVVQQKQGIRKLPNVRNQLENSFFLLSNASNPESIGPAVAEISRFEYWAEEVKIL